MDTPLDVAITAQTGKGYGGRSLVALSLSLGNNVGSSPEGGISPCRCDFIILQNQTSGYEEVGTLNSLI